MLGLVSITDQDWFTFLSTLAQSRGGRLDEVNFWRPKKKAALKIIDTGAPFFLRLKHPHLAIAGWGFFAHWQLLPFRDAWQVFGEKNGAGSFDAFARNIRRLRGADPTVPGAAPLGCIVLRDVTFLPPDRWLSWRGTEGWRTQIVNDKSYELHEAPGRQLLALIQSQPEAAPPDLVAERFAPLDGDDRRWRETSVATRDGQGTFRLRVLDAYGARCALTGERVVPVLEAAHIQPYLGPASNHIQNGLLLRADLHNLYDAGYVTITPDYRFRVSDRVEAEYSNGKEYYAMQGRQIRLPSDEHKWPSREALALHEKIRFS